MATLPDGTTVNSQTVEGWNIDPPSGFTSQVVEGWNLDPPPVAGISITSSAATVTSGSTVDVSGTVTIDGAAAGGETVTLTATGPAALDTPDPTTDANGDYSVTVGPLEESGDYTFTSEVNGIQKQTEEGWNQ